MKTFEQCCDEIAKARGMHNGRNLVFIANSDEHLRAFKEVAELYADEVASWNREDVTVYKGKLRVKPKNQDQLIDEIIIIYSKWANNGEVDNQEQEAFSEIKSKFIIQRK